MLVAAAACGVAFSTHYYCIFLALPLTWAIVPRWREQARVSCCDTSLPRRSSAIVFFALSPFLLVEPMHALRDITANRQIVIDRAVQDRRFRAGASAISRCSGRTRWARRWSRSAPPAPAGCCSWPPPARSCCFSFRSRSCVHREHRAGQPLPESHPAIVALLAAWTLASLATCSRAPHGSHSLAAVACAAPAFVRAFGRTVLSDRRHPRHRRAVRQDQVRDRRDDPDPAVFRGAHSVARRPRRSARRAISGP